MVGGEGGAGGTPVDAQRVYLAGLGRPVGRVALGTWSMGGWMWGGSDEREARATIERALDLGIDLIDTAPVYGFGLSESLVGEVLASHPRGGDVAVATKYGFVWDERHEPWKHASPDSVLREVDDSRRRLGRDVIDLYLIHWPDPDTPIAKTADTIRALIERGVVRAAGVCNYSAAQIAEFTRECPLAAVQNPYSVFQREIEAEVIPQAQAEGAALMAYSPLARGLLTGGMRHGDEPRDEARRKGMFHGEEYERHLIVVERLDAFAHERFGASVLPLALRWVLDGVEDSIALWGARKPWQLDGYDDVWGWTLSPDDLAAIERLVDEALSGR